MFFGLFKSKKPSELERVRETAKRVAKRVLPGTPMGSRPRKPSDEIESILWTLASRIETLERTNIALRTTTRPSYDGARDYRGPLRRVSDKPAPVAPPTSRDTRPAPAPEPDVVVIPVASPEAPPSIIREGPPPFHSGRGGDYAGAGASASWAPHEVIGGMAAPAPVPASLDTSESEACRRETYSPAPSPSYDSGSSDSSSASSDSSSDSSSSND